VNETTVINGTPAYAFSWSTNDTPRESIFTVRVHFSPRDVSTGFGPLTPNDLKIDFEIHNYPFLESRSRLALQTNIQSQTQSQNTIQNGIQNRQINFNPAGELEGLPFGAFSWVPKAGNGSTNVVATCAELNHANQFDLYFSFLTDPKNIHGDIDWDPTVGLAYTVPSVPSSDQFCLGNACGFLGIFLVVLIVLAIIVVVGLVAYFGLKRKSDYDIIN